MLVNALRNPHFRLFAGAFLISFSPVYVELVGVSPTASGFYRCLIGGIALAIYLLVARRKRRLPVSVWPPIAAAAVFFALDLWFWHRSIVLIGPGLATLLANLQVFFMIGAGILWLRERPSAIQIAAAPLAMLGLGLLVGGEWFGFDADYRAGVTLGLFTAMSYAGYLLSMRRARRNADDALPAEEVACVSLLVALLLGVVALIEKSPLTIASASDLGWLLAYGVLAHAFGLMLIASSLTAVTAATVGIALLSQPVLSLLWDVLLFGRAFSAIEVAGAALTLFAIFLGAERRSRRRLP